MGGGSMQQSGNIGYWGQEWGIQCAVDAGHIGNMGHTWDTRHTCKTLIISHGLEEVKFYTKCIKRENQICDKTAYIDIFKGK